MMKQASRERPFMQFDKLSMRCYFPDEVKRLSVVAVTQVQTFDESGAPKPGGLYDPAFGASGVGTCVSCGLKATHCPGHFGHIELSVPVFNPMLFSIIYNLMKGSCIHCHRLTCNTASPAILDFIKEWTNLPIELVHNNICVKNTMFKEFLRDNVFKRRVKCPHCKNSNGILRNDSDRAFILDFGNSMTALRKANEKKALKERAIMKGGKRKPNDVSDFYEEADDENMKNDTKNGGGMATNAVDDGDLLDPLALSEKYLKNQLDHVIGGKCDKLIWRAAEVREHFRLLWKRECAFLRHFFPIFDNACSPEYFPMDVLFFQIIPVTPAKFRPQRFIRGESFEHPFSAIYRRVLEADQLLTIVKLVMTTTNTKSTVEAKTLIENKVMGKTLNEKLHYAYLDLQVRVNCLYDEGADKFNSQPGLKQVLEKKEGLFRMHMMGKRVDYACRSVITPDPYLDIDEIGIPDIFAKRLTFQEPINYLNVSKMRELIRNGVTQHPGANFVQLSNHVRQVIPSQSRERSALSVRMTPGLSGCMNTAAPSFVFRHLDKGDHLLMNRQPSLHKPSIMGHKARILQGQKALRMNYAPCKAYNADFDGDEMNGHFLQNRVAQVEASDLANVANNYLVPKDGTPILGLIQDHVVSGVLLTLRDRFLDKGDFMHLVLSAFAETSERITIPPPTIYVPKMQWTGKQVISTIIQNTVPEPYPKINLFGKAKTSLNNWRVPGVKTTLQFEMSESQVIFRGGDLLCGVLDKEHYGATQYGLIHCCYELYGPKVAARLLSCFSRCFTTFLQYRGFTLGVADILVTKKADDARQSFIFDLRQVGPSVVKRAFQLEEDASPMKIKHVLASAYNNPRKDRTDVKQLDFTMKQFMAKFNEQINNSCVPNGLIRCFPDNSLQMMIQTGAKGSLVNSIQISCALGQIELEGQRPPLSAVGRSLPSFRCFDPSPRAGGFVDQRFLTGLNPQELFFHTMAGREGLIDTAVKTSRSGYLQRCIIKHLEGISVRYDQTVRDHDGSVIQFRYGEDGLDVGRATFIHPKQFRFFEDNMDALRFSVLPKDLRLSDWNVTDTEKYFKRVSKWKKQRQVSIEAGKGKLRDSGFLNFCQAAVVATKNNLIREWSEMLPEQRKFYEPSAQHKECVDVKYNPSTCLGALPEKILEDLAQYSKAKETSTEFRRIMYWKGMKAYVDPGENVGLLAAQSIGEPSTQMTLNTFHFAGRGEMNVTLGIPRLREILMTSGKKIATPMTEIQIREITTAEQVERLKMELNPVGLKKVLKRFVLEEQINTDKSYRQYVLSLHFLRVKSREPDAKHVGRQRILNEIEKRFAKDVAAGIAKRFRDVLEYQQIQHKRLKAVVEQLKLSTTEHDDENNRKVKEDVSSDEDEAMGNGGDTGDVDASEARLKQRHADDGAEYEGEEDEQEEVEEPASAGGLLDVADDLDLDDDDDVADSEAETTPMVKNENGAVHSRLKQSVSNGVADFDRIKNVVDAHPLIVDYQYDPNMRWCKVIYQLPLKSKTKLDVKAIVEAEVDKFVVYQVRGIEKVVVREEQRGGKPTRILQTQGINLEAVLLRTDTLDVNTFYSNDVNLMLTRYGIEACGRTIAKEMNNVFGVYGIEVNPRHLSLTADYMTFTGEVMPFSRASMAHSASPLQKMTYETTVAFMRDAIITGQPDKLCSPSARLVTGQLHRGGTGTFDLLTDPKHLFEQ